MGQDQKQSVTLHESADPESRFCGSLASTMHTSPKRDLVAYSESLESQQEPASTWKILFFDLPDLCAVLCAELKRMVHPARLERATP